MSTNTVERRQKNEIPSAWDMVRARQDDYELLKDSEDPIIQTAIKNRRFTEGKNEVRLPRAILRSLGHTIIDSDYYRYYPWIGGPPPVSMRRLASVLGHIFVDKRERHLLRERLKSQFDDEYDIDKIPRAK